MKFSVTAEDWPGGEKCLLQKPDDLSTILKEKGISSTNGFPGSVDDC